MNDSQTNKPEAPFFAAFREASFGIGSLVIHNETHAKYSWHRHACGSSAKGAPNYGMNFSDHCATPGDKSPQLMLTSDEVWLVRPAQSLCPQRWLSVDADDFLGIEDLSSDSTSVVVAAIVSTFLIFGSVIVSHTILILFVLLSSNIE